MGLFRRKKKSNIIAVGSTDSDDSLGDPTTKKTSKSKRKLKKGSKKKTKSTTSKPSAKQPKPQSATSSNDDEDEISSVDLGDIPRSISTTTHDSNINNGYYSLPPPAPQTPNREDGRNDVDSIGSPCEAMRRLNDKTEEGRCDIINITTADCKVDTTATEHKVENSISTKKLITKLNSSQSTTPSLHLLPEYTAALTKEHSPDTAGELPSKVLRALFSLSEHKESHEVRMALVRDGAIAPHLLAANVDDQTTKSAGALVPTLLTFLQRCPKDSSEQYLTLLVLNNLSIPMENKRLVGLECGAVNVLGRMLLEDVGCHLLVIVIVNLTFCDKGVRRSLLLGDCNESGGKTDDGEVQLVDCLAYALMLSSITTEQLSTLGPIPLHSPDGTPHTPHELLSILRSTLSTNFPNYIHNNNGNDDQDHIISPPLLLSDNENCPFPETARWCLCALKNLTRPGKWNSSSGSSDGGSSGSSSSISLNINEDVLSSSGDAIAARAIIDAGLVPILLRVIRVARKKKKAGTTTNTTTASLDASASEEGSDPYVGLLPDEICNEGHVVSPNMVNMPTWNSNSAQDAALYTLMHMASMPSVRGDLLRKSGSVGGSSRVIDELKNIVDCGLGVGDRLLDVVTGDGLVADVDREDGAMAVEGSELGWLALQCMKARMSLSYLLNPGNLSEKHNCSSYILIAEHEAHSFVELLSHCLEGRSKEGPGGYSGATFTLRGVLHSIRCLLAMDSGNRSKFASINGARLNALLLKVVARYALLSCEGENNSNNSGNGAIDNEAVDDAVMSLYYMSLVGFHESVCMSSHHQSPFLPSTFVKRTKKSGSSSSSTTNYEAKDIIVKVLTLYIGKISSSTSSVGRHAAIQLMLRASLLHFEGEVTYLPYLGKRYPSRMDFNFDDELLVAVESLQIEKQTEGVRPKPILFGQRQIARYERYGSNEPKLYANPMIAAEDIAFNTTSHSKAAVDDIAIANDIASCAEGLLPGGEAHGFIWEWYDGVTVVVDDVQSQISRRTNASRGQSLTSRRTKNSCEQTQTSRRTIPSLELTASSGLENKSAMESKDLSSSPASKQRGILGKLGNMVSAHDDEPISIFGFRCAAPRCGRNTTV